MAPKLYMTPGSPFVTSVLLGANAIGLELELQEVDLFAGEQFKPEFSKLNPRHTVPVLDDNGFILWDSHAILPYLIGKYGRDKSLYPDDLQKRAVIDQMLHFDSNVLTPRAVVASKSLWLLGRKEVSEEYKKSIDEAVELIDKFLERSDWIAGNSISIADYYYLGVIPAWALLVGSKYSQYPKLSAWLSRMKKMPCYNNIVVPALKRYGDFLSEKTGKNFHFQENL